MKSLINFNYFITLKIMVITYWLLMALLIVYSVISMYNDGQIIAKLFELVLSLVGCRVMFELIIVVFKNNEYLGRIANHIEKTYNKE
ncbi:TPA: DUF4282 domain-containing protein [Klebsiella aerogenes]|nr:DUF4282 domain-containing protein [Klebsiella aerogenes]